MSCTFQNITLSVCLYLFYTFISPEKALDLYLPKLFRLFTKIIYINFISQKLNKMFYSLYFILLPYTSHILPYTFTLLVLCFKFYVLYYMFYVLCYKFKVSCFMLKVISFCYKFHNFLL